MSVPWRFLLPAETDLRLETRLTCPSSRRKTPFVSTLQTATKPSVLPMARYCPTKSPLPELKRTHEAPAFSRMLSTDSGAWTAKGSGRLRQWVVLLPPSPRCTHSGSSNVVEKREARVGKK